MIDRSFTPTGCLLNAFRRDVENNDRESIAGLRSTREVAEFCSLTVPQARRELDKLVEQGIAEVYDGKGVSGGEGDLWRLAKLPDYYQKLKVIRSIGGRSIEVEASFLGFQSYSVLPVQVEFEDGSRTGYLHQEIREIIA